MVDISVAEAQVDPALFLEFFLRGMSADPSVAGSPSFDLSYPKIPGRNLEGVPNANDPVMREKLLRRFIKNPGGQKLPVIRGV